MTMRERNLMQGSKGGVVAAAVVLLLAATACSNPVEPAGSTTSPPSPEPTRSERHEPGGTGVPEPGATLSAADREDARNAAVQVMTYYARPGLTAQKWAKELTPLLADRAVGSYQYVDPANVAASKVTGDADVVPPAGNVEPSPRVITVDVPTDAGTYRLVLSRSTTEDRWKAARINPPGN